VLVSLKDCPPAGIYVPGGFTPNGDGRNDLFKPVVYGSLASYEFSVFNRNGQLVFTSKDTRRGWDGRVNGHIPSSNVFVWFCSYQIKGRPLRVEKGTVVLIE
jgi:gliding motility-associated-like protein